MLSFFQIAFMCAVIGYIYAEILIAPGMVLFPFWKWLCRTWLLKSTIVNDREVINESWFYKPLGGCYKCVTGQLAFWWYLFGTHSYNFFFHVFSVCLAILFSVLIHQLCDYGQPK